MPNERVPRYRMAGDELVAAARDAAARGYGTVVMQAGEDPGLDVVPLSQVIRTIKAQTSLAITLSLGERSEDELWMLRQAGADRYLLRFETSNEELFRTIHPLKDGERKGQRMELLGRLREMGYELGSGVMIGLPGQSLWDLASDIELFQRLDLDMIGVGPYIAHPQTPLASASVERTSSARRIAKSGEPGMGIDEEVHPAALQQALPDELTTYKMIALARLACPRANIPSTTALATINPQHGQSWGLQRGANVIMPNLTPAQYRREYQIYPHKAGAEMTPRDSDAVARDQLRALGRPVARGRGDAPNMQYRRKRHMVLEME